MSTIDNTFSGNFDPMMEDVPGGHAEARQPNNDNIRADIAQSGQETIPEDSIQSIQQLQQSGNPNDQQEQNNGQNPPSSNNERENDTAAQAETGGTLEQVTPAQRSVTETQQAQTATAQQPIVQSQEPELQEPTSVPPQPSPTPANTVPSQEHEQTGVEGPPGIPKP